MKCDELKYERLGDANKTYPASTLVIRKQYVDEAIAELKDIIEKNKSAAIADASMLGAEIHELKEKIRLAEMAKDDAEATNTEYREDIKRLEDKVQQKDFFWDGCGF